MGIFDFMQKDKINSPVAKVDSKSKLQQSISLPKEEVLYPNTIVGKPKIDYNKHFESLLKEMNIPGPDILEFIKALTLKDGQPLTEEQKYKDVFNVFSVMGVSSAKFIETGNLVISKIKQEEDRFNSDFQNNFKIGVEDKRKKSESLQKQIKDMQNELATLLQESANNENTLNIEKSAFNQALNYNLSILNTHINNIKTYLNGTNERTVSSS